MGRSVVDQLELQVEELARRENMERIERQLEEEYALRCGLRRRPGMLRLVANPIVLQMLIEGRVRHLATLEGLRLLHQPDEKAEVVQ